MDAKLSVGDEEPVDPAIVESVRTALADRHAAFLPAEVAALASVPIPTATAVLHLLTQNGSTKQFPDGRYISAIAAGRLVNTANRALSLYHRRNPLRRGMPTGELRDAMAKAAETPDFDAVLVYLARAGSVVREKSPAGDMVRLPDHSVVLPPAWQAPTAEILGVYRSAGLNPPMPGNFQAHLPRDIRVESILDILVERGDLVPFGDGIYLSAEAVTEVWETVRRFAAASPDGDITVGALRDMTGSSRRIIVPLLEYFDSRGLTQRVGDSRVINERPV